MRLITIQNKKVLETLLDNKLFTADFDYIFNKVNIDETNKFMAYQILMRRYGYKFPPIFCCVLDRWSSLKGTKISKNSVILELEIFDSIVNLHNFDVWVNLQHCIENGYWNDTVHERYNPYLDGLGAGNRSNTIQAVIPYIKPSSLINAYEITDEFIKNYDSYIGNLLINTSYNKIPIYKR